MDRSKPTVISSLYPSEEKNIYDFELFQLGRNQKKNEEQGELKKIFLCHQLLSPGGENDALPLVHRTKVKQD